MNIQKEDLRKVSIRVESFTSSEKSHRSEQGYFHRWSEKSWSGEDGLHRWTVGLIELRKNGQVTEVDLENIMFVDHFGDD